jgi:prepilin-type processing-associated H-X9-DG protein
MVIMGETGCYEIGWKLVEPPDYEFIHTKPGDNRWNTTFADGHAQFTRFTIGALNDPNYTFDRTQY